MNNHNKLVSIGLPVRNGQRFFRRALNSLLSQDYKNFELIISDNASTDKTKEICQEYAKKDQRIRYIRQQRNIGMAKNFDFVLRQARGKYFMWAASDDWWDSFFISFLKTALDKHSGHGVAMSSFIRVCEDGALYDKVQFFGKNDLTNLGYFEVYKKMLASEPIHIFIQGLFRTKLLKKIMERPMSRCIAADRILMAEFALTTHFYSASQVLHQRTVAKKSITDAKKSIAERYGDEDIGKFSLDSKRRSRYVWKMLIRIITSPTIPWQRKFLMMPFPWLTLVWRNRYTIAEELFPRFYLAVRKIK